MKNLIRKLLGKNTKNSITFENMNIKKFSLLYVGLEHVIYTSSDCENIAMAKSLINELISQSENAKKEC